MGNSLTLKWGTLKGWSVETDEFRDALQKYADFGMAWGAMQQRDSDDQKVALCDAIDLADEIYNDWSGEKMTRVEAKKYVMEYGE